MVAAEPAAVVDVRGTTEGQIKRIAEELGGLIMNDKRVHLVLEGDPKCPPWTVPD